MNKELPVIIERIDGLRELMNEKFEENQRNHESMLSQVTYTNGRVKSLIVWRAYITGGLTILSILVVPVLIFTVNQFISKQASANVDEEKLKQLISEVVDQKEFIRIEN